VMAAKVVWAATAAGASAKTTSDNAARRDGKVGMTVSLRAMFGCDEIGSTARVHAACRKGREIVEYC